MGRAIALEWARAKREIQRAAAAPSAWPHSSPRDSRRLARVDQRDNISHLPKPIRDPGSHRWSDAKALVDANDVVPDEVERQRVAVIVDPPHQAWTPNEAGYSLDPFLTRAAL